MIKKPYEGQTASEEAQIKQLEAVGIVITDKSNAMQKLKFVGYYRLFSYVKPFLQSNKTIDSSATLERIWELYVFDRKLRLLVIDAIERIEVAFRVSISEIMSRYSPFWYIDSTHFNHLKWHIEFMEKVLKIVSKRDHHLIRHFYETYSSPDFPPSWIMVECLTFGTWSKVFDNLKKRGDKIAIANRLKMPFMTLLSWIRSLTELRNLCAHHERIWNQFFRHTPKDVPNQAHQEHRFYQQACIINGLLTKIDPGSTWKNELFNLMRDYPQLHITQMGFQQNWMKDNFWSPILSFSN
ncbi:MAG: Abi family protein [Legionellales bacterium]|nr:Abi family protein [Legionellales bacterium]